MEQQQVLERDRIRHEEHRANMSSVQRQAQQESDRLHHERRREQETPEERESRRERERIRHEDRRVNQSQHEIEEEQAARREYQAMVRDTQDEEENETSRQRERIRRSTVRRGHALAKQANFRVSMLSGPNIVDGRHRLPRTTVCLHCNAWKWPAESTNACRLKGAVQLPTLKPAPPRLLQLYEDAEFRRQIRAYNQVFAFTSIGASCSNRSAFKDVNQDESVAGQHGVYTYRIQGAMDHYLGSLLPRIDQFTNEPVPPKFAQIYIMDPEMQQRAERRRGIFADLESGTLLDIEHMMAEHNPFARQFLNYAEKVRADRAEGKDVVDLVYRLHENKSNPRTHNLPTVSEVGATLIEDGNLDSPRDILLWAKDHRLLRLFETNPMYDPLQYPLVLPHGDLGWTFTDEYADNIERRSKREMSLREHVAYRLFQKVDDESALHQGGRLFQQYCVDQRAKCEQEQLRWIASNQAELRADQYRGVPDALLNEATTVLNEGEGLLTEYDRETGTLQYPDGDQRRPDHFLNQIGKRIVLPSTHSGSPRAMYKSYQDSMAIVREYGKPAVFVTMTCNPTWEEIEEKIPEPNQSAQDRPDIVTRVWQQKLAELLKDLDEGVLGRVMARIYVVEFQKRGLPHAHILVILADEDKPRRTEIIDKLVSAELLDADVNPQLYKTILTSMMHGPCGAANPNSPCMKDGKCTKGYPKPLVEVTQGNVNGFPVYRRRRRPPGVLKFKGREYDNATINQWVVPYNPYLSQKYNCHINVEVCATLTAVKYLYKYVYKGSDKAVITVETVQGESHRAMIEPNEILRYLNARYISPVEACMRLLDFSVQGKTHSIVQLTIHLENEQLVTFRSSDNPDQVLTRGRDTMLTRFFELCASEAPENQEAKTMVYQDIPKKFCWDAKTKRWVRRKRFQAAIGRMVHVSPRDLNKFYMRVLLFHRKGPQSFEQLRTVDGVTYETYRQAALKLGYLEDDAEWVACMTEAAAFKKPYELRQLFATIIVYSQVAEVRQLWDQFYDDLPQDYAYTYRALQGQEKEDLIQFKTLKSLHDLLQINGYTVADFDDFPQLHQYPELVLDSLLRNSLLRRELEGYDQSTLQSIVDQENQLNDGQRAIYDEILQAVDGSAVGENMFFIDGPGGT